MPAVDKARLVASDDGRTLFRVSVSESLSTRGQIDPTKLVVSVLGEVRAARDGEALDLGSPKSRAVLTALAMAEGHAVDMDALAELVWPPAQVPRNPVAGLQVYISGLRRVIEPPRAARTRHHRRLLAAEPTGNITAGSFLFGK